MFTNIFSRKYFTVLLLGAVLCFGVLTAVPLQAQAQSSMTSAEMQIEIDMLMQLIAQLTSLIQVDNDSTTNSVCPYTWTRSLSLGDTGEDVKRLQQFLNASSDTRIVSNGLGSLGRESNYYGKATADAVAKFQVKYRPAILSPQGLINPTGVFDSTTLAKVNALCADENVAVDFVSQSTDRSSLFGIEAGKFEIIFDVTTLYDDIYITNEKGSFGNVLVNRNIPDSFSGGSKSTGLDSTAERVGMSSMYIVEKGSTERFTLSVDFVPEMSGDYKMVLDWIAFDLSPEIELSHKVKLPSMTETDWLYVNRKEDLTGLHVDIEDTDASVTTVSDTIVGEHGEFEINLEVTAYGDDMYVYSSSESAKDGTLRPIVVDENGKQAAGEFIYTISSSAESDGVTGDFFEIQEGKREEITITADFAPENDGFYRMVLEQLPYVVGYPGGDVSEVNIDGARTDAISIISSVSKPVTIPKIEARIVVIGTSLVGDTHNGDKILLANGTVKQSGSWFPLTHNGTFIKDPKQFLKNRTNDIVHDTVHGDVVAFDGIAVQRMGNGEIIVMHGEKPKALQGYETIDAYIQIKNSSFDESSIEKIGLEEIYDYVTVESPTKVNFGTLVRGYSDAFAISVQPAGQVKGITTSNIDFAEVVITLAAIKELLTGL